MIFLAALPSSVCFATCDRSMSPVARVADAVLVGNVGRLRALTYVRQRCVAARRASACSRSAPVEQHSPAPGGPIRTMRGALEGAMPTAALAESSTDWVLAPALFSSWPILSCS